MKIRYLYLIPDIVVYFLVISFSEYKKYTIFLISFSNFSDALSAFTCARAIGSTSVVFKFLSPLPCVDFIGNIQPLKALRVNSQFS